MRKVMKKDVTPLWRAVMVVLVRVPVLALALTLAPEGTAHGQDATPSLRLRMLAAGSRRCSRGCAAPTPRPSGSPSAPLAASRTRR